MARDSRLASDESGHTSTSSMKSTGVKTLVIFSSGNQSAVEKTGGCMPDEVFFDLLVLHHPFAAACCQGEGVGLQTQSKQRSVSLKELFPWHLYLQLSHSPSGNLDFDVPFQSKI